ncbi:MAG: MauE/DoxX family redox-associated membrane protein [Micropruina sp.]
MTPALAVTVAALLAAAGAGHLRPTRALVVQLRGHGVLPRPVVAPVAVALIGAEVAIPVALVAGLSGSVVLLRAAALTAAVVCLGFAGYLHLVARRHPEGVPCGCGLGEAPAGPWTVLRALILAGFGVWVALAPVIVADLNSLQVITNLLAALALSIVLAGLPVARALPAQTPMAG